jgi:hypothetical protein
MASKSKKLKKPEPVTVSVREYVAERAGTHSTERKSALKNDFMAWFAATSAKRKPGKGL